MGGSSHIYAKASLVSGMFAFLVHHQAELSTVATIVAIVAGVMSIVKGLKGK